MDNNFDSDAPKKPDIVIDDLQEPREPELEVAGERALWRAVLTQALMDASNLSEQYEAGLEREKARRWLLSNDTDFTFVCLMANHDPLDIRRKVRAALARDCLWRKAPVEGAETTHRR